MYRVVMQKRGADTLIAYFRKLQGRLQPTELDNLFGQKIEELRPIVLANIKGEAPIRTGRLVNSLDLLVEKRGAASYRLAIDLARAVDYLEYVLDGTQAHLIRPRRAKVLRWAAQTQGGQYVFSRFARHPGTKPNDFVQRGFDKSKDRVRQKLNEFGRALFS